MSDSLRRTGGGRGWRLLARALVVAGAAAAGGSAGWLAHAEASPLGVPGLADEVPRLAEDSAESAPEPAAPRPDGPLPRAVSAVEHTARELTAPPEPDAPEQNAPDQAAESPLRDLVPDRLVGRVAEAAPVQAVVRGAGAAVRPVVEPPAPASEAGPPVLGALTRPVADLARPLWTGPAAPPPATSPPPAHLAPAPPAQQAPAAPARLAPAAHDGTAAEPSAAGLQRIGSAEPVRENPAQQPGPAPAVPHDLPVHRAALPAAPAGAVGGAHLTDVLGGGLGLPWPPAPAPAADIALRAAEHDAARSPRGTCAPAPGTTPD